MSDQGVSQAGMGKTPQYGSMAVKPVNTVKDNETHGSKPWITWIRQKSLGFRG